MNFYANAVQKIKGKVQPIDKSRDRKKRPEGDQESDLEKDFSKILANLKEGNRHAKATQRIRNKTPDYTVSLSVRGINYSIFGGEKKSKGASPEYSANKNQIDIIA